MLRKQSSNFKAFEHSISNIYLDNIKEKWEFDHLLRIIQSRWSAIDSLHWELDSELCGREAEYEATYFRYERKYNEVIKEINRKMWSSSHREQSTPHLELPSFSGDYHQWTSFKDLFIETIHNNPSLSSAQRMQFLKSKLKGEAERLIQHLTISSDNYAICWDILTHRYDHKKLILNSHLDILFGIPVMQQVSVNHLKRIHDTTRETLNAIKNLGVEVDTWDPLLVYILCQKLDSETHSEYVASVKQPREVPNITEFLSFIENKFTTMESSKRKQEAQSKPIIRNPNYNSATTSGSKYHKSFNNNSNIKQSFPQQGRNMSQSHTHHAYNNKNVYTTKYYKCPICRNDDHGIFYCRQFLEMPPIMKRKTIIKFNICQNCLYCHNGKPCISDKKCRECNQAHNTLLHEAFTQSDSAHGATNYRNFANAAPSAPGLSNTIHSNSHVSLQNEIPDVLLATAIIKVQTAKGSYINLRILLDQGSQASLISENAAQRLGLPRFKCQGVISGIGSNENNCKGMLHIKCLSTNSDFEFETNVLIINNLVKNLPSHSFAKPSWPYLQNITLADPDFNTSRPIDILLGADIYSLILLEGICRTDQELPIAQNTRLGWILSGNVRTLQCNVILNDLVDIQKFWQIEDITQESDLSVEDQHCMDYFKNTTTRREDGRYEVRIPFKPNFEESLGDSKSKAIAQFRSLERKFSKNQIMENHYKSFMEEYISLGHMIPATDKTTPDCYLTHHSVERSEAATTKFRVVFNASSKTSSGNSLNDVMASGPNLQQDLQALIIKWRQYQFAFTADCEKMFRQIWVNLEDQKFQKIIWRDSTKQTLKHFQLSTVTYGTKSAPFLAMMTLRQLASDERSNYSNNNKKYQDQAPDVLERSCYMDDLVHGGHSVTSTRQLCEDLITLLKSGGFNLRKWRSNVPEIMQLNNDSNIPDNFNFKQLENTKTLGLSWNPQQDTFSFDTKIDQTTKPDTKRSLLSDISKLFDPLGWLAPLSTKLKIIFQRVWSEDIKWDDRLPEEIQTEWSQIKEDIINNINNLKINRWLGTKQSDSIELHGFCDASLKAYACVIYCRIKRNDNTIISLFVGKARLIPSKSNTSLPKLEMSGALLLSKLMSKVKECMSNYDVKVYGWSDSMIVLGWLNGDPARWKAFVANRVKEICHVIPPNCWRYVRSEENPADCASRGLTVSQLADYSLWWKGPSWLSDFDEQKKEQSYSTNVEMKITKQVNTITEQTSENSIIQELLTNHSSFIKVVRITAWILRFASTRQNKQSYLTLSELKRSKTIIIKHVQQTEFSKEINSIKEGSKLPNKSKLTELNPFLDKDGLLRVGGRLRNAPISLERKHPIIIPNNCRLAELVIDQTHKLTFHGGPRLTSAFLRHKYWILGGNRAVKKQLRRCITCRHHEPTRHQQLMGDLPASRTTPSRPYYCCGVDLTGFVDVKSSKGRGIKSSKGYIVVFVCMVTKAVHLEIVSDLTSSSFLSALRRMSARRGAPRHIYSDNGTNFVGASRALNQEYFDLQNTLDDNFFTAITDMEIEWHFNAPSWPSAGGLWEAAVKSLKYHLKRVIGDQKLTFEEYSTLLAQLEACLNARPLCPLTEDCEDLDYLTPSHFLASGPTLTIIETEKDQRTRWQLVQKIFDDIWRRWQNEYLGQLSARSKWRQAKENFNIDDIVLIHDANLPSGKWAMGRIVTLHPGKDGYVRVVTLKTKNGFVKRPITKISLLPTSKNDESTEQKQKPKVVAASTEHGPKRTYISKPRGFLFSIFMWLLLITTPPVYSYHQISSLNNTSQSLYFDKIGSMRLENDQWKLIIYYEMDPYWQGIELLNKYVKHLESSCISQHNNMKIISQCDIILLQLHHGLAELEHYNGILGPYF